MKPGASTLLALLLACWVAGSAGQSESPGSESAPDKRSQRESGPGEGGTEGADLAPAAEPVPVPVPAPASVAALPEGDVARGRLVFARCRTCHYAEAFMGHNNGPNLHRIFGKVVGKQPGFEYYSETFRAARFVWTPQLMFAWLENPMAMFPDSTMMSLGVPDPQQRADLIAFLRQASVRESP